jgi:D-alanine-D-alanine ligase
MAMTDFKGKRIGVIMGGPSSEREVSLRTGRGVLEALLSRGHDAVGVDWRAATNNDGNLPAALQQERVQVAWIALHGVWGEDGCVQGLLECLGIPYTGSGVMGSAIAMDKVMSKRIFDQSGAVGTARWRIYSGPEDVSAVGYPLVVKPSREGSSVGVTIVRDPAALPAALVEAKKHHGEVLVEEYVKGREINVAVLEGWEDGVLGEVEVRPAVEFYTYEAKYQRNDTQYLCPAPVTAEERARLGVVALAAHRALGCSGYSRVDLILGEGGRIICLEVNTLPGMTEKSLLPKIAAGRGMDYAALVEHILRGASLKA